MLSVFLLLSNYLRSSKPRNVALSIEFKCENRLLSIIRRRSRTLGTIRGLAVRGIAFFNLSDACRSATSVANRGWATETVQRTLKVGKVLTLSSKYRFWLDCGLVIVPLPFVQISVSCAPIRYFKIIRIVALWAPKSSTVRLELASGSGRRHRKPIGRDVSALKRCIWQIYA